MFPYIEVAALLTLAMWVIRCEEAAVGHETVDEGQGADPVNASPADG
jgi:hypothetical protein